MKKAQKMSLAAMITAIGVLTSHLFYIPLGLVKAFPVQHVLNVLSAVLLGPYYAVFQAFMISLFRNMIGTGSILAFPGSMAGALLAAWLYQKSRNIAIAAGGEVAGTGLIGAMLAYPLAAAFLGKEAALFGFVPAFLVSSLAGAVAGGLLLQLLVKNDAFAEMISGRK